MKAYSSRTPELMETPVKGMLIIDASNSGDHNHNWDPRTPSCSNNIGNSRGNKLFKGSNISRDAR